MKSFLKFIDGYKTYSAIVTLVALPALTAFGVPLAVVGGLSAIAGVLGIAGRVHAGGKIANEIGNAAEVKAQLEALQRYIKDGQR